MIHYYIQVHKRLHEKAVKKQRAAAKAWLENIKKMELAACAEKRTHLGNQRGAATTALIADTIDFLNYFPNPL